MPQNWGGGKQKVVGNAHKFVVGECRVGQGLMGCSLTLPGACQFFIQIGVSGGGTGVPCSRWGQVGQGVMGMPPESPPSGTVCSVWQWKFPPTYPCPQLAAYHGTLEDIIMSPPNCFYG